MSLEIESEIELRSLFGLVVEAVEDWDKANYYDPWSEEAHDMFHHVIRTMEKLDVIAQEMGIDIEDQKVKLRYVPSGLKSYDPRPKSQREKHPPTRLKEEAEAGEEKEGN